MSRTTQQRRSKLAVRHLAQHPRATQGPVPQKPVFHSRLFRTARDQISTLTSTRSTATQDTKLGVRDHHHGHPKATPTVTPTLLL